MLIIAAIAIPAAAVGINLAADDLWYDQNGKLVGNPIPLETYDEEYYEALKQQQLAEADSIKRVFQQRRPNWQSLLPRAVSGVRR